MDRRAFVKGLFVSTAALTTVSYFDMGASWAKRDDLYLWDGIDRSVHPVSVFDARQLEGFLKKYYNDRTVANLHFNGSAELFAGMR
jgi:hypothetical protein